MLIFLKPFLTTLCIKNLESKDRTLSMWYRDGGGGEVGAEGFCGGHEIF